MRNDHRHTDEPPTGLGRKQCGTKAVEHAYRELSQEDRLPEFPTFPWSRPLGTQCGVTTQGGAPTLTISGCLDKSLPTYRLIPLTPIPAEFG